jgi:hypothetical protein
LATPNYGFEKRQKELAKKKKKEEKLKMKSERKAGDPIEGEPEDGVQDNTPPSSDQPDAPATPAGA